MKNAIKILTLLIIFALLVGSIVWYSVRDNDSTEELEYEDYVEELDEVEEVSAPVEENVVVE